MFDKLLVANRGEIAVRVIRAAKELGLRTVAVFSEADRESLAVRFADEAVCIGPPAAAKSYLNAEAIIAAARETGAGAIHPGYGFLSENAKFAAAVAAAGLVFVGPLPETIRTMGDKAAARAAAQAAGVPIVPGSEGEVADLDHALAAAAAAFGSGAVYLERFLKSARHLEVQVLGDGERVVHCFERECSLQRRRQKVWEEAPSPAIDETTRQALCASAVRLAERARYRGAGTLEYLYDDDSGEFFFIEMNTRIQVEHPVTEMVCGLDLVREMILVSQGQKLSVAQPEVTMRGAAIEVRINAEDPDKNFRPSPGRVTALTLPAGPGVRVDTMLYPGYAVPPYYDSLLAKIIVHAETRDLALARLRRALDEFAIEGVVTTAALHKRLARLTEVQAARFDTGFLERLLAAT